MLKKKLQVHAIKNGTCSVVVGKAQDVARKPADSACSAVLAWDIWP